MPLLTPMFVQPQPPEPDTVYTAREARVGMLGSIFSRAGVLDYLGGHLRVTQRGSGADLSVDVAPGRCVIEGTTVADQGTYLCTATDTVNVAISLPDSGSRAYRVIARVRDRLVTAGADTASDWVIETVADDGTTPPATPPSAISLATLTVPAETSTVTTDMVADTRERATVGTDAITGTWGHAGFHNNYGADDATRPLTWAKNPDGWVILSGWIRRRYAASAATAHTTYFWDGTPGGLNAWSRATPVLPLEVAPSGARDFIAITSNGDVQLTVFPNGVMGFRFFYNTTLAVGTNQSWFSFDGCFYRATAF